MLSIMLTSKTETKIDLDFGVVDDYNSYMESEEFVFKICENRKLNPEDVVRKKYRTVPQITARDLFSAIFYHETVKGVSSYFNVGINTINRVMKELFPDVVIKGGSRSWKYFLLDLVGYKTCTRCKITKSKSEFYLGNVTKVRSTCKNCDKDSSAYRRSRVQEAVALDSDIDLIEQIYINCPQGYHVDHIVPLSKGGKHHQNNLCYLTAYDNQSKHDKLPEQVPDIMARAIYPKF